MPTTLYRHSESARAVDGVAFRVHDKDSATRELETDFGAIALRLGHPITGRTGEPGKVPYADSPFADFGLWVPHSLAEAFERELVDLDYRVVEEDRA